MEKCFVLKLSPTTKPFNFFNLTGGKMYNTLEVVNFVLNGSGGFSTNSYKKAETLYLYFILSEITSLV